jgi:HAD superfamily hydrolase (TIGR01509 family)
MGCAALIFDVDGTLADTEEVHRRAFNEAFLTYGLDWNWDPLLYGELLAVTGGKERIASYIARLPLTPAQAAPLRDLIPDLHRRKTRLYRDMVEQGEAPARPGVHRLITEARAAGALIAIASTTSPENIEPLIAAGFGDEALGWFAAVATGDVVSNKKPAPDIYELALRMMHVPAHAAVAIEDSRIGVQSAKAAGIFTVAIPSIWTRLQDFSAADLVLETLDDAQVSFESLSALHAAAYSQEVVHARAH